MEHKRVYGCYDCNVKEGELHILGCERERCNKCGDQFIYCSCRKKGIKRIPYIRSVNMCGKCGKMNPEMFMVSDKEWKEVIWPYFEKESMLCENCYDFIRKSKKIKRGKRRYIL
jgi:hypothetical protein